MKRGKLMADIISGKSRFEGSDKINKDNKIIRLSGDDTYSGEVNKQAAQKIKKHRRNIVIGVLIALVLAAIAGVILYKYLDGRTYSSYTISTSYNRDDTETAQYKEYGSGYVRYSNDGITYNDRKNNSIWNETYSMQKPQVKECGDCIAVGDINGSSIYIFDKNGLKGTVDTSLAISQIEVGSQGVVVAVLEDNTANYINMYNTDGSKVYSIKTTLEGDGYPLDISISDDATKLIASFVYVSGEEMKTNVVFYNFSEVGQNETERVVGGFNHYDNTIVADVEFVNDTTAVAVGENVVSIYNIKEYPSLSKEINIENSIENVFWSSKYIGLILDNSETGDLYKLVVYDLSGNKVTEKTFSTQYDEIKFDSDSILSLSNLISSYCVLNVFSVTLLPDKSYTTSLYKSPVSELSNISPIYFELQNTFSILFSMLISLLRLGYSFILYILTTFSPTATAVVSLTNSTSATMVLS